MNFRDVCLILVGAAASLLLTHSASAAPKALEQGDPVYPSQAASVDQEGWVQLSPVVDGAGKPSRVQVLDGAPGGVFERSALDAVAAWTFEADASAAHRSLKRHVLVFDRNRYQKPSPEFVDTYGRVQKEIKEDRLDAAKASIDHLRSLGRKTQYEVAFLDIALGTYYAAKKESVLAIRYLTRATMATGEHLTPATRAGLLKMRFNLQTSVGDLTGALLTYGSIKELGDEISRKDPIHDLAERIVTFIAGGDRLVATGRLHDACPTCSQTTATGLHRMARSKFYIANVEGAIQGFQIFCDRHWADVSFDETLQWSLAEDWGTCDLLVSGSEGTTYRVVEE